MTEEIAKAPEAAQEEAQKATDKKAKPKAEKPAQAEAQKPDPLNIYGRLQAVRQEMYALGYAKTGTNEFSHYDFFELKDILPKVTPIFVKHGLCPICNFPEGRAIMRIYDALSEEDEYIEINIPFGEVNLKGCHPAQQLGAAETYARRYLYMVALDIAEADRVDGEQQRAKANKPPVVSLDVANVKAEIKALVDGLIAGGSDKSALAATIKESIGMTNYNNITTKHISGAQALVAKLKEMSGS